MSNLQGQLKISLTCLSFLPVSGDQQAEVSIQELTVSRDTLEIGRSVRGGYSHVWEIHGPAANLQWFSSWQCLEVRINLTSYDCGIYDDLWWFLGFSSCHKTEWQSPTPSCRDMEKIYIKTTIKMEEFIESCCLERIFQLTHTDSFSKFC